MSGPTTDDEGPWSFDSLMNSESDEEDETDDMPANDMTVITVEYALFADLAASGELDAETVTKIDKLFDRNTTLGRAKSDNCIALAKQVGCTPNRLIAEFGKRRQAAGTQRAQAWRLPAETVTKIDKLFGRNITLGDRKSDNCIALAKQVGCTPRRLCEEFGKRRAAAGTQRAPAARLPAETVTKIDTLFDDNTTLGTAKSDNCIALAAQVGCTPERLYTEFKKRRKLAGIGKSGEKKAAVKKTIKKKSPPEKKALAPCTANKPAPMPPPQTPPEPMSPPPGWA